MRSSDCSRIRALTGSENWTGNSATLISQTYHVAEARAKFFRLHGHRRGQAGQSLAIFEVAALQPNHVAPRALVSFAIHVDPSHAHASGFRVDHFVERQRLEAALRVTDHRTRFRRGFGANKLHRSV